MKHEHDHDHEWTDEEEIIDEAELDDFDRALLESLGPDVTIKRNADGCLIYSLGPPEEDDFENGAN